MAISEQQRPAHPVASSSPVSAHLEVTRTGAYLLAERAGRTIVEIEVGVEWDGELLGAGSEVIASDSVDVHETYVAHVGKSTGERRVDHVETRFRLQTPSAREWGLTVRSAPDGLAFRYELPATDGTAELGAERTTYRFGAIGRLWTLDYQTWYETVRFGADLDELAPGDYGFPTLVNVGEEWILLSESDIDGASSGAHLVRDPDAEAGELRVTAADVPLSVGPLQRTPWRVAILGSLADVVASTLVDDLAPAADPSVPVVTRPGRGAWSWWSSQYSGAYLDVQKRFADYAADQGWEHVLVDCGWDAAWVPELVSHASRRGIQVHLWSSWSDLDGAENLRKLALWKSWGVAGIKVDFMESESRERYRWYDAIIAEAERIGLMLNFHGSVIPRGWARTHPNVVSYEGIRGAEYYVFYGNPLTAAHNVIQPFTRNVVGSMDYTPVAFSAPERETSDAHELALGLVYESGITHFADDPDQYRARPAAEHFLATLPPAWDEVRLLSGHPDHGAIVARRSGATWFVGGIFAGEAGEATFRPADLLEGGSGRLVYDDPAGGLVERELDELPDLIRVPVQRNGGFVAVLGASTSALPIPTPNPEQLPVRVEPALAAVAPGGDVTVITEPGVTVVAPPGWTAEALGDGRWRAGAPATATGGTIGVFSALREDGSAVPVVGHATLHVPLGVGVHALSMLPYLRARNAFGPVERDQSNGGGDPHDGRPLTVAGVSHAHGFGVADASAIAFPLGGASGSLTVAVGIDDETPAGSARALVVVDGTVAHDLLVSGGETPRHLTIPFAHASILELRTEPDPSAQEHGHVDWIEPHLTIGD